ncbi:hypothetical protein [Planktotalea sp.]|uniref:hypothetical protein n=1 Tax=Planktotalea sp. TaxID=2029877 RepID=UPI0025F3FB37|nr:hypothetical protein [Planktotalea sp.]
MDHAILNKPDPISGSLNESINFADGVTGLVVVAADLSAVDYLGEVNEINSMYGSKDTIVFEKQGSEKWHDTAKELDYALRRAVRGENETEIAKLKQIISVTPFATWSPFEHRDGATIFNMRDFWLKHGLTEFPFHGTPQDEHG